VSRTSQGWGPAAPAEYPIATNADVGTIEVAWIEEEDPHIKLLLADEGRFSLAEAQPQVGGSGEWSDDGWSSVVSMASGSGFDREGISSARVHNEVTHLACRHWLLAHLLSSMLPMARSRQQATDARVYRSSALPKETKP
jgi:hypothetical protein